MNTNKALLISVVLVLLIGTLSIHSNATAAQGDTNRVSVASDGTEGESFSSYPSISDDGRYIAFESDASNLVSEDTNDSTDVFVHDRATGQTTIASVSSFGEQVNDDSGAPSISGNGRYVAFSSWGSYLVENDDNDECDIFVHDLQTGETTRVSMASDGTESNDASFYSAISWDGRYIAFTSYASNLVPGDNNDMIDIFVHDRETGETSRVSVASDGTEGSNVSVDPAISGDGRYVAFTSYASNLVEGDTNGEADIFIHDRQTGETNLVSTAWDDSQTDGKSEDPSFSRDGRYVVYGSEASNLVENDTNGEKDAFVYDQQTGETSLVSVSSDGTQGNGGIRYPSISAFGRYVVYESYSTNLVTDDNNESTDIFMYDRLTGETNLVSIASDGSQGDGSSYYPSISAMGRFVTFYSHASNLVLNDTNGLPDVFVHETNVIIYDNYLPMILVSD